MAGSWKAPPRWQAIRRQVFERWGRQCWRCGAYATTVDHVRPRVLGGTDDPDNLRPACASCNYSTGASVGNRLRPPRSLSGAQRQAVALKRRQVDPNDYRTWRSSREW